MKSTSDALTTPARVERPRSKERARRLRNDRFATAMVTIGGIGIIACILAILLFIVAEVIPLVAAPHIETASSFETHAPEVRALTADPYHTYVAALSQDGIVRVFAPDDGSIATSKQITPPGTSLTAARAPSANLLTASTESGEIATIAVDWKIDFSSGSRVVSPTLADPTLLQLDSSERPLQAFDARRLPSGGTIAIGQKQDGVIEIVRVESEENAFTGEISRRETKTQIEGIPALSQIVVTGRGNTLFAGDPRGELRWWKLSGSRAASGRVEQDDQASAITRMALLIADRTLIVGRQDGTVEAWTVAPDERAGPTLKRMRTFPGLDSAVTDLAPSRRDKGFLASSIENQLGLYYSTSTQQLWRAAAPVAGVTALAYAPKADAAYVAGANRIAMLDVDNPHPEISLAALFSPVWYEGYPGPSYVWQSSSGTDDFEPKLSLIPLLIGTLKGTLYSLLIAIPLGVFGAMYVSLFMAPRLKQIVKPVIEIMAALPSVVLGFLAGLWLAPRLEELFPALILILLAFPVTVIAAGIAWEQLPARLRKAAPEGSEALLFVVFLAVGLYGCVVASGALEDLVFGGDFRTWLLTNADTSYDQRNAIVVGIAMGFAVIPIIFAIAEDAFSNVPGNLVSGSLALGANRWQTAMQVVLPTASPGIFSAIMVGFGRAVGETMIVLMATGNTPILDWSPFNGFRTLSANIAVEIPEAPQFGTLYRILFLAALLLFALTFLVNTAAEVVRQRLRRRYAEL